MSTIMRRAILLALCSLCACGSELDTFHVVRGGVAMPVVVRGPKDADTLIVFQHGGPGQAELDGVYAFEQRLQRRFLYASWGQRTSAFSTGRVTRKNSTLAAHFADMKVVLQALRARYPNKRLVALGYSFGGIVTLGHLGSAEAEPVDGIVLMDTPMGGELEERENFRLLDVFAEQEIGLGHDVPAWRKFRELAQTQTQDYLTLSPRAYFDKYVWKHLDACQRMEKALGIDAVPGPVESAGEVNMSENLVIPGLLVVFRDIDWLGPELVTFDLSAQAARIRVPTLLLWGEHDCQVALPAGRALLDATGAAQKALKVAPNTGHAMPMQAPDFAAREIERFIDDL